MLAVERREAGDGPLLPAVDLFDPFDVDGPSQAQRPGRPHRFGQELHPVPRLGQHALHRGEVVDFTPLRRVGPLEQRCVVHTVAQRRPHEGEQSFGSPRHRTMSSGANGA